MTATANTVPVEVDPGFWGTSDSLSPGSLTPHGCLAAIRSGIEAGVFPVVSPALGATDRAMARIAQMQDRYFAEHLSADQLVSGQVSRLLNDEDLGDEFLEAVHQYAWAARERETGAALLTAMHDQLRWRIPQVTAEASTEMLAALRAELATLLDTVKTLDARLDGLDPSNSPAVAGGTQKQRDAVAALPALVTQYWQLRNGQKLLTVACNQQPPGNDLNTHRWTWAQYLADRPVWEHKTGQHYSHADPVARLLAISRDPAVWMPTYDELVEEYDAWWNTDTPVTQSVPIPDLKPGQWIELRR